MSDLCLSLKTLRLNARLSQSELANSSGVSLATLQKIEAGRANPSLNTLQSLFSILGIGLTTFSIQADLNFDSLIPLGLPLMENQNLSKSQKVPTAKELVRELGKISNLLKSIPVESRFEKSLISFLWALEDHYPEIWKLADSQARAWCKTIPYQRRSIKLRRISIQRLAQYL
jgi:transcriptional regulator with XRE-family HTH domain